MKRPVTRVVATCLGAATAFVLGACQSEDDAAPGSELASSAPASSSPPTTKMVSLPQTSSSSSPETEPVPAPSPIDTSSWLPFVSENYGYSISYPPEWEANQGSGDWTFPKDTAWPDGVEVSDWFTFDVPEVPFVAASVWWVGLEPGKTADEWFRDYCAVEVTPCDGTESSVALSVDGHAGRLVHASDPLAYFGLGDRIYMAAAWQPDDTVTFDPFGGGYRFLELWLSTMKLLPDEQSETQPETDDLIARWLDTSTWVTDVSERYEFTINHPASWTVVESSKDWDQATDSINWDSGGAEVFIPPDDTVSMYLAAWSVDVQPATTLAEWSQAFCDQYVASCTDIEQMSESTSASGGESEGVLLAWDDGVIAFFPTWYDPAQAGSIWDQPAPTDAHIYVVESGRPDTTEYRSREFVEAFAASLCARCAD